MNYLQQVINFLSFSTPANEQEATLTLHDFYYGPEVELVGGGEELILWEEGEPHRCPVREDRELWLLVLLAEFALQLWGDEEALAQTEERYCHFRVASEDILRQGEWPKGNLGDVGGEEAVEAARSWPHYNDLCTALRPLLAAMYNNN